LRLGSHNWLGSIIGIAILKRSNSGTQRDFVGIDAIAYDCRQEKENRE